MQLFVMMFSISASPISALPKQADIDKMLKIIQRKVLYGTHLPVKIKEIQAVYLANPYFKNIDLYLVQNKLPNAKATIQKVETLAVKQKHITGCLTI